MDLKKIYTIEEIENYRKSINESCDERIKEISKYVKAAELGKTSFACIKENIENLSPSLLKTNEGVSIINQYISLVKNSKALSTLHSLCETISKAGSNSNTEFILNEISSQKYNVKKSEYESDMENLGKIMECAYVLAGNDSLVSENSDKFGKSLDYLVTNEKTAKNLSTYGDALNVIKEEINKKPETNNSFDKDNSLDESIKSFNKSYGEYLSDFEASIIKSIANGEEHSSIFESAKKECSNKLSEAINRGSDEEKARLISINEKIMAKTFREDTFTDDVCSLIEVAKIAQE